MRPGGQIGELDRRIVGGAANNLVFAAAGHGFLFCQSLIVMRVVGPEQTGLVAMALAIGITLDSISDFGFNDRLVQVEEARVRESFALALAAQLVLGLSLWIGLWLTAPAIARFYRQPELESLIVAIGYMGFGGASRLPAALLYRDLRFFEQRLTLFAGRLAGFVVTIATVMTGAGVWSLVYGGVAMVAGTGVTAWWLAPCRPDFRRLALELRPLLDFGVPLWLSKVMYMLVQQGGILVLSAFLSVGDVGQFRSAEQLASLVFYLEIVLAQTIFPVLCRRSWSDEFVSRVFVSASRISMVWIAAVSVGLCLFAADIVRFVLTPEWAGSELFLRAHGVALIFGAAAFSWDAVLKARNNTVPILRMAMLFLVPFTLGFVPLVMMFGRLGAAFGLVVVSLATLAGRYHYLRQLNLHVSLVRIMAPALGAAALAAGVTLAVGALLPETVGSLRVGLRLLVFVSTYGFVLYRVEGPLFRRVLSAITHRAREGMPVTPGMAEGRL